MYIAFSPESLYLGLRLVFAVEKELAQLFQHEVDAEVTGDDDNEIGEGADGEMNENAVVCCNLRVTATPTAFAINRARCAVLHLRFALACSYAKISS